MKEVAVQELKLTLETITPLFLGGADPTAPPELRAPSLRGALRYWLRAALGGVIGDGDLKALKEAESQVFGSTAGTGAVSVRILSGLSASDCYRFSRSTPGQSYLYWSMAPPNDQARQCVRAKKEIEVLLSSPTEADDWRWFAGLVAIWLLVQLGGLGARSRRTAGSLGARPFDLGGGLWLGDEESPESLAMTLRRGFQTIRQRLAREFTSGVLSPRPAFDVFHPRSCTIWILADRKQPWGTWEKAVESIGATMREFRTRRQPDSSGVAAWQHGRQIKTVERAVFGLPLPFRYSNDLRPVVQGEDHGRRASPLWLKVARLRNGEHAGVATLFRSAFLGVEERLEASKRKTDPPQDYDLVEQFIRTFPGSIEVEL